MDRKEDLELSPGDYKAGGAPLSSGSGPPQALKHIAELFFPLSVCSHVRQDLECLYIWFIKVVYFVLLVA